MHLKIDVCLVPSSVFRELTDLKEDVVTHAGVAQYLELAIAQVDVDRLECAVNL